MVHRTVGNRRLRMSIFSLSNRLLDLLHMSRVLLVYGFCWNISVLSLPFEVGDFQSAEWMSSFTFLMLLACFSYMGSRHPDDANSRLRVIIYTIWTAPCAPHHSWNAYEYQQLWYFPPVLCAMIVPLDLYVLLGS